MTFTIHKWKPSLLIFLKIFFFITFEGEYCLFSLRTLYNVANGVPLSPPEGYMFPGSEEEKSVHLPLLTSWSHYLPHSWLLMQPLWYCSSIINNYVVLMSVGFTTWVGKLNGTCYTSLHLEF